MLNILNHCKSMTAPNAPSDYVCLATINTLQFKKTKHVRLY